MSDLHDATNALMNEMDVLIARHGHVYQVFAPGGAFLAVKANLAGALEVATLSRGIVLEVDRGGVAKAFDHTGRRLSI